MTLNAHTLQEIAEEKGLHKLHSRPGGFKGHNFMTNRVVGFYRKGPFDVELSLGEFMGDTLAGVTVVRGHTNEYDLSGACFSLDEVREKLEGLTCKA